jgi:nucleoside-triphosphatase THEP1
MKPAASSIATVIGADTAAIQTLFAAAATKWRSEGLNVVGLIAETHGLENRVCRAGYLRDVASGKAFSIYVDTPRAETSCHLDSGGVDSACEELLEQIANCDLVVLSKYGKLEAEHSGLAPAFDAAIKAGKPILTTVSDRHREAWKDFAAGAVYLSPDKTALDQWRETIKNTAPAA